MQIKLLRPLSHQILVSLFLIYDMQLCLIAGCFYKVSIPEPRTINLSASNHDYFAYLPCTCNYFWFLTLYKEKKRSKLWLLSLLTKFQYAWSCCPIEPTLLTWTTVTPLLIRTLYTTQDKSDFFRVLDNCWWYYCGCLCGCQCCCCC